MRELSFVQRHRRHRGGYVHRVLPVLPVSSHISQLTSHILHCARCCRTPSCAPTIGPWCFGVVCGCHKRYVTGQPGHRYGSYPPWQVLPGVYPSVSACVNGISHKLLIIILHLRCEIRSHLFVSRASVSVQRYIRHRGGYVHCFWSALPVLLSHKPTHKPYPVLSCTALDAAELHHTLPQSDPGALYMACGCHKRYVTGQPGHRYGSYPPWQVLPGVYPSVLTVFHINY